jgi:hypothetical protein
MVDGVPEVCTAKTFSESMSSSTRGMVRAGS